MVMTTKRGEEKPLDRLRRRYAGRTVKGERKAGEPLTLTNTVAPTGTLLRLQRRYLPAEAKPSAPDEPEA